LNIAGFTNQECESLSSYHNQASKPECHLRPFWPAPY
jgi:hypothetical protein